MSFLVKSIQPRGVLSFLDNTNPVELTPLNVLIGPNGSGKSNFLEMFELLKATPTDFAELIRQGGGVDEWLWKGEGATLKASLSAILSLPQFNQMLKYRLDFGLSSAGARLEILDEAIEDAEPRKSGVSDVYFYYRFQRGHPAINIRQGKNGKTVKRKLSRDSLDPQQSVLSQRKDPDLYPEVTAVGRAFGQFASFREWTFGRTTPPRHPQRPDHRTDILLPDGLNLGLLLNQIEHSDTWGRLNECLRRFLPAYEHLSTKINPGGTIQIFLHEKGLGAPIPATRLSDGTIRFLELLAILLRPEAALLVCLEEPELGMHPDALNLIAELLVEASQQTQIVVTTHSDVLVSALSDQVESVLVCERLGGATVLRRLEAERLNHWLEKYRLGEIWRMGEIGGNL